MNQENKPFRFTLRKEYFGGLVHDAETTGYELINPQEYEFLQKLAIVDEKIIDKTIAVNPDLKDRIKSFTKLGFVNIDDDGKIDLVNIRLIKPQANFLENRLTVPIRVYDTYTRKCNLNCEHCYFSSSALVKEKRRTIEQTVDIMKKFFDVGTMEWRFTGGEPTIHPDLFDAISEAKKMGMNVSLNTNGWLSEKTMEKILNANISEIVISLEGKQKVNDVRRKQGAFAKALETLDAIHQHNKNSHRKIEVIINTAVGKDNINDVDFLVRLAAKYGFNINFIPLKPSGRARDTLQDGILSTEEFMLFSKKIQQLREDKEIIYSGISIGHKYKDLFCSDYKDQSNRPSPFNHAECSALTTAISMLPDGRVFSCPFVLDLDRVEEFVGPNMISSTVQEAWFSPNMEKFRNAEKINCKGCVYYMKQCRGSCRATVLGFGGKIEDGKLIGNDPYCFASLMQK